MDWGWIFYGVGTWAGQSARPLLLEWALQEQSSVVLWLGEGLNLFLYHLQIRAIIPQIAAWSSSCPMLQAMGNDRFVLFVKGCAKSVHHSTILAIPADLSRDRDDLVQMVRVSRIMLLLGHLGEVTSLSVAHCYLPVLALHVLVMRLLFKDCPTIDAPENFLEAVIAWVDAIRAAILDRQTLLQTCNAGWLEELFLCSDFSQLGRTLLTWQLAHGRWVARRWWWW